MTSDDSARAAVADAGEAGPSARRRWLWASLVVPVVAAVALALWSGRDDPGAVESGSEFGSVATSAPTVPPVDLRADTGARAEDVAALVRASDVVVEGTVVAVQRGRAIGSAQQGIVTRFVELRVSRVLTGDAGVVGADGSVIVEEEGWLPDGRPVRVNGVEPSAVGDRGVYFLVQGASEEFPYTAVVSDQGRFLVDPAAPDRFRASGSTDPLVRAVEDGGVAVLVAEVAG